ncbi:hypothetical protein RCL1_000097 [Eukaryota sp. TZLM3-RCL]
MSLIDNYSSSIRPLLDKIDKARYLLKDEPDFPLPTIVVIGIQSAGKSSVIESLSNIKLPRSEGCCTRLPIEVRLHSSKSGTEKRIQVSSSKHHSRIVAENDLESTINQMTCDLAGKKKNIVDDPITVEIFDENLPNLSIIDLPGITHNAIGGQPEDIYTRITELYMRYISADATIICNVHPATIDVATSESIKLSRMVDPQGVRTICVLSKLDKSEIDVLGILSGDAADVVPLKLGYVAVVNPSAADLSNGISFQEARLKEKQFFSTHPTLSKHNSEFCGIDVLSRKLVSLQNDRITRYFPQLRAKVQQELTKVNADLQALPPSFHDESSSFSAFLQALNHCVQCYQSFLNDTGVGNIVNLLHVDTEEVVLQILNLKRKFDTPEMLKKIAELEQSAGGHHLSNFIGPATFNAVFRELFQSEIPITTDLLISKCHDKCLEFVLKAVESSFGHLEGSLLHMTQFATEVVQDVCSDLKQRINLVQQIETNGPYTSNHYYSETLQKETIKPLIGSLPTREPPLKQKRLSEDESRVDIIQTSLKTYWKVMSKRFCDYLALYIRDAFLFSMPTSIQNGLLSKVSPSIVYHWLRDDGTEMKRTRLMNRRENLRKVSDLLVG